MELRAMISSETVEQTKVSAHSIFARTLAMKCIKSTPWTGVHPLGGWLKDGNVKPFFSILSHSVSGGGLFVGESTAKFNKITGESAIVPMKVKSLDFKTGEERSYWKFQPAIKVGDIEVPEALPDFKNALTKLGIKFKTLEQATSELYFILLNNAIGEFIVQEMSEDDSLTEEDIMHNINRKSPSLATELATHYLLAYYGLKVPEGIMDDQRKLWTTIKDSPGRWFTNLALQADRLIRELKPETA